MVAFTRQGATTRNPARRRSPPLRHNICHAGALGQSSRSGPSGRRPPPTSLPGHDEQSVEAIKKAINDIDAQQAKAVRDYERARKDRTGVLEAAEQRIDGN
jgi:hypothetical protein